MKPGKLGIFSEKDLSFSLTPDEREQKRLAEELIPIGRTALKQKKVHQCQQIWHT